MEKHTGRKVITENGAICREAQSFQFDKKNIFSVSESKNLIKVGGGRMSGELMVVEEGRGRGRLQHMATIDLGSLR